MANWMADEAQWSYQRQLPADMPDRQGRVRFAGLSATLGSDERGRDTVYRCLEGSGLPWLAPVGRLDQASEGLLLMSNDPAWAAAITDPATGPEKTYHVQVGAVPDAALLAALHEGIHDAGEHLSARSATSAAWRCIQLAGIGRA